MKQISSPSIIPLIQQYTVDLYNLKNKAYQIKTIPARELLSEYRFDLFAKLYYIRHYKTDKRKALQIYTAHFKAFCPDGKELGRPDKQCLNDFLQAFDYLIDYFKNNDFDPSVSIVPVSEDNIILDGAHRIAALAFWNKEVVIAKFENVKPKYDFNYSYFRKKGLPTQISNEICIEMLAWKNNLNLAFIFPRHFILRPSDNIKKYINRNIHPTIYNRHFIATRESIKYFTNQADISFDNCGKIPYIYIYIINDIQYKKIQTSNSWTDFNIYITRNNELIEKAVYLLLTKEGQKKWLNRGCALIDYITNSINDLIYYLINTKFIRKIKPLIYPFYITLKSLLQKIE